MVDVLEYTGSSKVMTHDSKKTGLLPRKFRVFHRKALSKNQDIFKSFPKSCFTYAHISNGASCSTFVSSKQHLSKKSVLSPKPISEFFGYTDVGDGCWRRMFGDKFGILVATSVTKIEMLIPTHKIGHQWSPTLSSPNGIKTQISHQHINAISFEGSSRCL